MDVFGLFGIAAATAAAALTLRHYRPELALQVSLAGGAVILIKAIASLGGITQTLNSLFERSGVGSEWFGLILKIFGIAYVTQISADICRDAGESALAAKTELCGKIMMLACALPAVIAVVDILMELAEGIG